MSQDRIDDPRRQFLIRALATGLFAVGGGVISRASAANPLGEVPRRLRPGKSIYRIEGEVLVNGQPANADTLITANDHVTTGDKSQAIFVVGRDAFMMREKSQLQLSGKAKFQQRLRKIKISYSKPVSNPRIDPEAGAVEAFRLITGGVLTVFGKTRHQAETSTASIGIRGTGVYFESESDRSYVCTCYGITDISALEDPSSQTEIYSTHHSAPKYILKEGAKGEKIIKAPFKNHDDLELMMLEELVGRTAPFSVAGENYCAPRRQYY
jgi:hypothetical protein